MITCRLKKRLSLWFQIKFKEELYSEIMIRLNDSKTICTFFSWLMHCSRHKLRLYLSTKLCCQRNVFHKPLLCFLLKRCWCLQYIRYYTFIIFSHFLFFVLHFTCTCDSVTFTNTLYSESPTPWHHHYIHIDSVNMVIHDSVKSVLACFTHKSEENTFLWCVLRFGFYQLKFMKKQTKMCHQTLVPHVEVLQIPVSIKLTNEKRKF